MPTKQSTTRNPNPYVMNEGTVNVFPTFFCQCFIL